MGEGGTQLSGGQRQRIAIARALIRDPLVLLLDEATSSVDGASEERIMEELAQRRGGRSTIVIAHRLSSLRWVDRIAVVRGGRVEEEGSPRELEERKGLYWKLLLSQQGRDQASGAHSRPHDQSQTKQLSG